MVCNDHLYPHICNASCNKTSLVLFAELQQLRLKCCLVADIPPCSQVTLSCSKLPFCTRFTLPCCLTRHVSSSDNQVMQNEEPWLGQYDPKDVSDMEILIMRALGWSPRALTPASVLDQLLWDALSGALYQLQFQPGDSLSQARKHTANIVSSNMTGVSALQQ